MTTRPPTATSGSNPNFGPGTGPRAVPSATWHGLVACLDISGMVTLAAARRVP